MILAEAPYDPSESIVTQLRELLRHVQRQYRGQAQGEVRPTIQVPQDALKAYGEAIHERTGGIRRPRALKGQGPIYCGLPLQPHDDPNLQIVRAHPVIV